MIYSMFVWVPRLTMCLATFILVVTLYEAITNAIDGQRNVRTFNQFVEYETEVRSLPWWIRAVWPEPTKSCYWCVRVLAFFEDIYRYYKR